MTTKARTLGTNTNTNVTGEVTGDTRLIGVMTDPKEIGMSHPIIGVIIGIRAPIQQCILSMGKANGPRKLSQIIGRQSVGIVVRKGIGAKHLEDAPNILIMTPTKHHVATMTHPLGKTTSKVEAADVRLEERRGSSTGKWGASHYMMHTVLIHVISTLQCHST
jgi:hypothetical protein